MKLVVLALVVIAAGCTAQPVEDNVVVDSTTVSTYQTTTSSTTTTIAERSFLIEGDDIDLYPSSIEVFEGEKVAIIFATRKSATKNITYNSEYWGRAIVSPGENKTVRFDAERNFSFGSYKTNDGYSELIKFGKVIVKLKLP